MSMYGERIAAWAREILGPSAKRKRIAQFLNISQNTLKAWAEDDRTPDVSASMIDHVAAKLGKTSDEIWDLRQESVAAEPPKGRTVTTTRTPRRRKPKLSELPIRRDIPGM